MMLSGNVRRQNSDADVRAGCLDGGAVAPPGYTLAWRASANRARYGGQLTLVFGMLIRAARVRLSTQGHKIGTADDR
jgi:hypothetical protein